MRSPIDTAAEEIALRLRKRFLIVDDGLAQEVAHIMRKHMELRTAQQENESLKEFSARAEQPKQNNERTTRCNRLRVPIART